MKDKYFTVIVCDFCKQGGGTLRRRDDGKYVHSKCPPKMRTVTADELRALQQAGK